MGGNSKCNMFSSLLSLYTIRRMTNEEDSLNAFLGLQAAFQRKLFPAGFVWGLPLPSNPELLGWFHDRTVVPKRRPMFPTWSWAGWEGTIAFPDRIIGLSSEPEHLKTNDMRPRILSSNDHELVVEGWVVKLNVLTEPFSEALVPGTTEAYGSIAERNFLHNNTVPSGEHVCLVVQRSRFKIAEDRAERQRIYLLLLELNREAASRKTMIIVTPWDSSDFMKLKPEMRTITLV
jgi:hypothetical protein